MKDKDFIEIFDNCLMQIKQGKSIEAVIRNYPDEADELKKMLSISKSIAESSLPPVENDAIAACLIKVGEEINKQKNRGLRLELPEFNFLGLKLLFNPRLAKAIYVSIFVVIFSLGTLNLSANSMPGELLYPLKLASEKVRFVVTINPEEKAELKLVFSEKRMKELVKHLDNNGKLDVETLKFMLDEANAALLESAKIKTSEKDIYISKLKYLNAHQKDILENIRSKVSPQDIEYINKAIEICNRRMNWMHGTKQDNHWGSHCMWR